ncbi:MAG: purine permease [Lachnospiraceae bacterium]|nr:purine permease [Lachnospiraceae bacterium]
MENTKGKRTYASIFELDGLPKFGQALPLALQHVVAMIVGCVTPAIIVAGVAGLDGPNKVILIQSALVVSAVSTFLQLFPIGKKGSFRLGSGLPVIMGVSFAYVASMETIASTYSIAAILGAQLMGGLVAAIIGLFIDKIRKLFPPMVTGTVVFMIGVSLYPTAVNYMAGGASSPNYGSWKNWLVAFITLAVVTILNHFSKGFVKLASILIGIVVGYILAAFFGMIDLSAVGAAGFFQAPQIMHFGIEFEPSSCIAIGLLFAINAIQAIGDFTATTTGSMDREPTNKELKGAIVGYGIMNMIGSFFGGLPTASYSQNVGIVTTTKVINRCVLGLGATILLIAGLVPKFSALLTTIPQCVLGGATISVFASIAMTGIKLIASGGMTVRTTSIVGLSVALGVGVTQASASLAAFPTWVTTIFGKSPVVIATLMAVILNLILPKDEEKEEACIAQSTDPEVVEEVYQSVEAEAAGEAIPETEEAEVV